MTVLYLFWGILIGILVAAPMGPVNIICIRRALAYNAWNGFLVGMGAALADTLFGAVAAFGLSTLTRLILEFNGWFEVCGGIVLLIVGVNIWRKHPHLSDVQDQNGDWVKASIGTFALTITNPMTILGFVALFAGLGLGRLGESLPNALLVIAGVFLGSSLWWFALTEGVAHMKKKLSDDHLLWINRLSSVVVIGFGLWALGKNLYLLI
ncbi:LysE family translocator [Luteithermobacter gelatinilyticus]|uniref:LysE family translocator n=1 Tax=Luteithermobacter gelatinilyticus TaxID=2582913 RepID=UPI001105ECDF|nr:LysE family transporter [Luteithermobacter gelatinilyticus]